MTMIYHPLVVRADEPDIAATSAILFDLYSGEVFWGKQTKQRVYPASITKLMTALLVLEAGDIMRYTTVSEKAMLTDGSALWVEEGEVLTVKDLLYGLLLISGNDAAVVLAEQQTGNEADFIRQMNQKAVSLGANSTRFANSHGLHEPNHYTTAEDYALIARAAWQNMDLRSIMMTPEYHMPAQPSSDEDERVVLNNNRLLDSFEGIAGGKNGFTDEAGYTFVGYAVRGDLALGVVLFNSNNIWYETVELLEYGFANVGSYQSMRSSANPIIAGMSFELSEIPPTAYGLQTNTTNRALTLMDLDNLSQSAIVSAILYEEQKQEQTISLVFEGRIIDGLPIWRTLNFWIFVQLTVWSLIFMVYLLLKNRIEYLSRKQRLS